MNLLEAVECGKRFRRTGSEEIWYDQDNLPMRFTREDILATDWEIEDRKIEITESYFDDLMELVGMQYKSNLHLFELKKRLFRE
jgi:hypothetical protein